MDKVAGKDMKVPREVAAEAAVWVTRLHGPHRSAELERDFRRWLESEPVHAIAFERSTATWEAVEGISAASAYRSRARPARSGLPRFALACAGAVIFLAAAVATWHTLIRDPSYATAQGEQRTILLDDGSRVLLNTRTRLVSHASASVRLVELEDGEALFEVAKDPGRPFVVQAGPKKVTALGTTFSVYRAGNDVTVTLLEGKVAVSDVNPRSATATLTPGKRLRSSADSIARIDEPALDRVFAWKRGEVIFDETPLADAVREMNRYGRVQLAIDDASANSLKVSGIFRAGDSEAFARAVLSVHHVELRPF